MTTLADKLSFLIKKGLKASLKNNIADNTTITLENDIGMIVEKYEASDKTNVYPIISYDRTKYFSIKLTPEQDKTLDIKYTLKIKLTRDEESFIYCFFRHDKNIYNELAEKSKSLKSYGIKITDDTAIEILDDTDFRQITLECVQFSLIKKMATAKTNIKEAVYWKYIKEGDNGTYAISRYLMNNLFPMPLKDETIETLTDKQIEQIQESKIEYTGLTLNLAELRTVEALLRLVYNSEYRFALPQYRFLILKRVFHGLVKDARAEETLKSLVGKLYQYRVGKEFVIAPIIDKLEVKDGDSYIITLNQYFLKDLSVNKAIKKEHGFEVRKTGFYHHTLNSDLGFTKFMNYLSWASVQHPDFHFIQCKMSTLLKSLDLYELLKKQSRPFVLKKVNLYFEEAYGFGYFYSKTKYSILEFNDLLKNGKPLKIKINKENLLRPKT